MAEYPNTTTANLNPPLLLLLPLNPTVGLVSGAATDLRIITK